MKPAKSPIKKKRAIPNIGAQLDMALKAQVAAAKKKQGSGAKSGGVAVGMKGKKMGHRVNQTAIAGNTEMESLLGSVKTEK